MRFRSGRAGTRAWLSFPDTPALVPRLVTAAPEHTHESPGGPARRAGAESPVFFLRGRGSWDSRSPGKAQVRGVGPQGTEPGAWPCLGAGAREKAESGSRTLQRRRPHPASGPDLQDRKRPRWRCSWQPATAAGNEPLGCVRARRTPGGVAATRSSAGEGGGPRPRWPQHRSSAGWRWKPPWAYIRTCKHSRRSQG